MTLVRAVGGRGWGWLNAAVVGGVVLGLSTPAVQAAEPLARITIVDGEPLMVREASRFHLAEGVHLARNDILETGAQDRLLRIEFSDGRILDLGPSTRLLLAPGLPSARGKAGASAYLLHGWVKTSIPADGAPSTLLG